MWRAIRNQPGLIKNTETGRIVNLEDLEGIKVVADMAHERRSMLLEDELKMDMLVRIIRLEFMLDDLKPKAER